jgi:hypothetical protein
MRRASRDRPNIANTAAPYLRAALRKVGERSPRRGAQPRQCATPEPPTRPRRRGSGGRRRGGRLAAGASVRRRRAPSGKARARRPWPARPGPPPQFVARACLGHAGREIPTRHHTLKERGRPLRAPLAPSPSPRPSTQATSLQAGRVSLHTKTALTVEAGARAPTPSGCRAWPGLWRRGASRRLAPSRSSGSSCNGSRARAGRGEWRVKGCKPRVAGTAGTLGEGQHQPDRHLTTTK